MQYMQGMAHAEFPDYVSDVARNLILRLCRWTMLIFFIFIPWSALGAFVRVKAHIMDDVDDSNTDFHTPMQLCYHIGLVISTDIIKAM